jgi:hypothetical protein
MWCTGISGLPAANASPFAKFTPTSSAPIKPGAKVTATPSISLSLQLAFSSASSQTCTMLSACRREAISGTTPPYKRCSSTCEATMADSIFRPFSTTAQAVSSQEVSIPSIFMLL